MTNTLVGIAFLATLLMLAPLAAADQGNQTQADDTHPDDTHPDDAAWVDDCPPDMMCAYGEGPADNDTTRGPEDCAHCRDHQGQHCVDCLGAPEPADNTTWDTDCPPGVYCMSDGTPDDDGGSFECDGGECAYDEAPQEEDAEAAEATGPAAVALVAALGMALTAGSTLRRR